MAKVMVPSEDLINPSWSYRSTMDSCLEEVGFRGVAIDYEMASSGLSSIFLSDACHDELLLDYLDGNGVCLNPSRTGNESFDEVEDYFDWMQYEGISSSRECSVDGTSTCVISTESSINFGTGEKKSLIFPKENVEIEDRVSICHLLKALGEAKENRYDDLSDVILRRLEEKACPKGSAIQRLAYYLVQSSSSNLDHYYLMQEAIKNYDAAFSLFYQIFPYGRLAHFVANSTILEALPEDAKTIHIVDFDLGEGVQWPPLMEAISKKYPKVAVRLISLKWDNKDCLSHLQSFGNTKKRLCEHANTYSCRLALTVEEMGVEELATEMKRIGSSGGRGNWVAFNCMRNLPHMGKPMSSRHVAAFLEVAQEYLGRNNRRGIVTVGSGNCIEEKGIDFQGAVGSTFEAELRRVSALLESMELQMPLHLSEARVAMECIFVAPYLSSLHKWTARESKGGLVPNIELGARKISKYAIAEAKELVGEGSGLYRIRTEGENENEVVLSFKGTPLLRLSSWST